MRVTSSTFPTQLKTESNDLLNRENTLNQQISTGMNIINPSDDVAGFGDLTAYRTDAATAQQYAANTGTAQTAAQTSYQGMADLQTLMSRVSDLVTEANGTSDSSTYNVIGTEMSTLADQIVSIVNRQSDGVYLYGGTANVAPLIANPTAGATPPYVLNTSTGYNGDVSSTTINTNLTVSLGITAGSTGGNGSTFNGFLYKAGQTNTDTYTLVASLAKEMLGSTDNADGTTSDPFTAEGGYQGALKQVNAAVSLTAESVGITSAKLTQLTTNATSLSNQSSNLEKTISNRGDANTAALATDLTTVQTAYQAALQSGSKILSMSLLDYIN